MMIARVMTVFSALVVTLLAAGPVLADGSCGGCTPDSFVESASPTKTMVGGVLYTVDFSISVTVYGTDCQEVAYLICEAASDCGILAQGSYTSGFGGLSLDASTVNPLLSTTILQNLPAAPSGSGFGAVRRDTMACGVIGHEITFCLSWTSDSLNWPSSTCVNSKFGCSACKLGGV